MPTRHSGFLIQSSHGERGNFELVRPSGLGGLNHCWRDNDDGALPWYGAAPFANGVAREASLIQSNFGGTGHLEVVALVANRLEHYWRDDTSPWAWHGPTFIATGASGNPAFIQGSNGDKGNFELVAPLAFGGLVHFWRDNDSSGLPWIGPALFGGSQKFDAVAMIQSNFGSFAGHLELVARAGGQLWYFWRDDTAPWAWHGPTSFIPAAVAGIPALIQSRHGDKDNFELVTPLAGGGLAHFWRDNDSSGLPWIGPALFGGPKHFDAVALIQSNFGDSGKNLEVVARLGGGQELFWRDDSDPWQWHPAGPVACGDSPCDGESQGEWRVLFSTGVVGIHAAVLPTGNVLFYSYREGDQDRGHGAVLDPRTGTVKQADPILNLFCSGQAFLPDGRLYVAGGNRPGVRSRHTFAASADAGSWQQQVPEMRDGRWYPTCSTLPDGRIFVISGSRPGGPVQNAGDVNATYEISPTPGPQVTLPMPFLVAAAPYALYPFVHVLPTGKIFIHIKNETRFLDLANLATGALDATVLHTRRAEPRTYPLQGTSVLLPLLPTTSPPYRARVMLIGGGGLPQGQDTPATGSCELLDMSAAPLAWRDAAPMPHARVMPDAVLLPDGTVLVVNGSSHGKADDGIKPVFAADLYDPETNTWRTLCSMRVPRLYHSTAVLLPDGRVLTAGKDEEFNPDEFKYPELRGEVFTPPYLFRGPQPEILTAPLDLTYGATFAIELPDTAPIRKVALLRPASVTHSFDTGQRYVGLVLGNRTPTRLLLEAPPSSQVAPPGFYMLFALDDRGVPSRARFVRLH